MQIDRLYCVYKKNLTQGINWFKVLGLFIMAVSAALVFTAITFTFFKLVWG